MEFECDLNKALLRLTAYNPYHGSIMYWFTGAGSALRYTNYHRVAGTFLFQFILSHIRLLNHLKPSENHCTLHHVELSQKLFFFENSTKKLRSTSCGQCLDRFLTSIATRTHHTSLSPNVAIRSLLL